MDRLYVVELSRTYKSNNCDWSFVSDLGVTFSDPKNINFVEKTYVLQCYFLTNELFLNFFIFFQPVCL